jgi:hypothetical protein
MKRNRLALGGASTVILAGVALAVPAMAQSQTALQAQDQTQSQDQSQTKDQSNGQDAAKTMHVRHHYRMSQAARQTAKEDRSEDRITAQLNQQQLAEAGTQSGEMSGSNMTNTGNTAQPGMTQQGAQRPDDNPQTNNCVAVGSGVNCSNPTPNSNGSVPPGPQQ